jgi:hypothetical protein
MKRTSLQLAIGSLSDLIQLILLHYSFFCKTNKPIHHLLWRTHHRTMISINPRHVHLVSARLLNIVNAFLLDLWRNTLVIFTEKVRNRDVFVPSIRQFVSEADGRVLRHFLDPCDTLLKGNVVEDDGGRAFGICLVEPAVLVGRQSGRSPSIYTPERRRYVWG